MNKNSLIPAIQEGERFISFLDKKFKLGILEDFIISFHKQRKSILGTFTPKEHPESFRYDKEKFHIITINTIHLKGNPYETLAHELAHFVNEFRGIKDCTANQYHNKKFKLMAESLLLSCKEQKGRGYAHTEPTPAFNEMVDKEFKKNEKAFEIFQNAMDKKNKQTTRNFLFSCSNECFKVRCGDKDFDGICSCGKEFRRVN